MIIGAAGIPVDRISIQWNNFKSDGCMWNVEWKLGSVCCSIMCFGNSTNCAIGRGIHGAQRIHLFRMNCTRINTWGGLVLVHQVSKMRSHRSIPIRIQWRWKISSGTKWCWWRRQDCFRQTCVHFQISGYAQPLKSIIKMKFSSLPRRSTSQI